jgi:hypothetical protein
VFYDPAGLALHPGLELSIGGVAAWGHLTVGDGTAPLRDPGGLQLTMRAPLPLAGPLAGRIVVGLGLHLLPGEVARVIAPAPDQPSYPWYGDRLARIVVLPGVAVRVAPTIVVGVAVNVLAGLAGSITAGEGATRAIDVRADERVPTVARIIAGALWDVAPAWRLGLVYHQRYETPFATTATTEVAGEPIDLDLRAAGQFTPHAVVAGVAWSPGPLVAALDLGYARWSDYAGPFVHVDSQLPLIGPVPGQTPVVPFDDTVAVRLGLESTVDGAGGVIFRGGYGFQTSPVPAHQTGVTNLLDGPHHTVAVGLGYAWPAALGGKGVRLDAHLQLQIVGGRTLTKRVWDGTGTYDPYTSLKDEVTDDATQPSTLGVQLSNPGYPRLSSGGEVVAGGLTLTVGL